MFEDYSCYTADVIHGFLDEKMPRVEVGSDRGLCESGSSKTYAYCATKRFLIVGTGD